MAQMNKEQNKQYEVIYPQKSLDYIFDQLQTMGRNGELAMVELNGTMLYSDKITDWSVDDVYMAVTGHTKAEYIYERTGLTLEEYTKSNQEQEQKEIARKEQILAQNASEIQNVQQRGAALIAPNQVAFWNDFVTNSFLETGGRTAKAAIETLEGIYSYKPWEEIRDNLYSHNLSGFEAGTISEMMATLTNIEGVAEYLNYGESMFQNMYGESFIENQQNRECTATDSFDQQNNDDFERE